MDTNVLFKNDNFVYDPAILGFDAANFVRLSGSADPTVSSSKLRFTQNSMISRFFVRYIDLEFIINVPTQPASGHDRIFGLRIPALTGLSAPRVQAEFVITGATFKCLAYDDAGTKYLDQTITWDNTNWSAHDISYRILHTKDGVKFFVAGVCVARAEISGNAINPKLMTKSKIPMAIHVRNANNDNMDMTCFVGANIASLS